LASEIEKDAKDTASKHVAIILEILAPFSNIKFNEERGFYLHDTKQKLHPEGSHRTDASNCRVCEACFIF
jgi:hypothetical protein